MNKTCLRVGFLISIALLLFSISGCATSGSFYDTAPRVTAEELKQHLNDPNLAIIDLRINPVIYFLTGKKIANATRQNPHNLDWLQQYHHDQTFVLYCS